MVVFRLRFDFLVRDNHERLLAQVHVNRIYRRKSAAMVDQIEIQCPNCGEKQQIDRDYENRRGRCLCGEVFIMTAVQKKQKRKPQVVNQAVISASAERDSSMRSRVSVGKYCHACGNGLHVLAELCPSCGVRQVLITRSSGGLARSSDSEKQLLPAVLLWFFLGFVGAHSFYAGHTRTGVIYIICFFFGCVFIFPMLVVVVLLVCDCINLVTGNYKDSTGNKITQWMP